MLDALPVTVGARESLLHDLLGYLPVPAPQRQGPDQTPVLSLAEHLEPSATPTVPPLDPADPMLDTHESACTSRTTSGTALHPATAAFSNR